MAPLTALGYQGIAPYQKPLLADSRSGRIKAKAYVTVGPDPAAIGGRPVLLPMSTDMRYGSQRCRGSAARRRPGGRKYSASGAVKPNARAAFGRVASRSTRIPRLRKPASSFRYSRPSPEVIRLVTLMSVWFRLSLLRSAEDLLFERWIDICHETEHLS